MTRKINTIVTECTDIWIMAFDELQRDARFKDGNIAYTSIDAIATMVQHMLVNERIDDAKQRQWTKTPNDTSTPIDKTNASTPAKMVLVQLTDGDKLKLAFDENARARLKELGFRFNKEPTYWQTKMNEQDWNALKTQKPFVDLTATVI